MGKVMGGMTNHHKGRIKLRSINQQPPPPIAATFRGRQRGGHMPNYNTETGIRFGCAMMRDLADWVMSEIEDRGIVCDGDPPLYDAEDWEWEAYLEGVEYEYKTEVIGPDGKPGPLIVRTFELGGAKHLWVELSPWTTRAPECSPCVPGAGDLRRPYDRGDVIRDEWVECYDLPPDWWWDDGEGE